MTESNVTVGRDTIVTLHRAEPEEDWEDGDEVGRGVGTVMTESNETVGGDTIVTLHKAEPEEDWEDGDRGEEECDEEDGDGEGDYETESDVSIRGGHGGGEELMAGSRMGRRREGKI